MMTELSGYVFEPLWEDGEFILSRGVRDGERSALLVMSPALAQPAPGSLRRLEHAYGLRDELDPAWAVRPLELVRSQGQPQQFPVKDLEVRGGAIKGDRRHQARQKGERATVNSLETVAW